MLSSQKQEMSLWKYEPVSPSRSPLLDVEEDWPLFDDQSVEISNNAADVVMYEENPSRAQVAKKLLEELDEWIKEGKISYILFDDIHISDKCSYRNVKSVTEIDDNIIRYCISC